ncbi:MAG: hypothetical protein ACOZAJ_01740 [Patescibacteria group bacterium]
MTKVICHRLIIVLLSLNCLKAAETEVGRWQKTWQTYPDILIKAAAIVLLPNFLKQPVDKDNEPEGDPEPFRFSPIKLFINQTGFWLLGSWFSFVIARVKSGLVEILSGYKIFYHSRWTI